MEEKRFIKMNLLQLIVFISSALIIITTGLECTWRKYINNQPRFGPECIYICHCMDDVQCDSETGECPNGCAAGWTGPGCQYGDVAYRKKVTQKTTRPVSNTEVVGSVDGNIYTCSQTKWEYEQWWRADLGAIYRISGLLINSWEATALKGFEVGIGNGSGFPGICFRHRFQDSIDTVTNVVCTSEQIGRHVMIWLPGKTSRITLCDVRAYSVCTTSQNDECSGICGQCEEGSLCDAATRTCVKGCQPRFWGLSCMSHCGYCKENTTCSRLEGYCFQCSTGKWGYLCDKNCTGCLTGTGCDVINGTCLKGCLPCCFGINCNKTCGNCAGDASCDRITGKCLHGCLPGWTEEDETCNTECPAGSYGQNCSKKCGFCINDTACERIAGTCRMGCASGYTGDVCNTSCPSGRFGQNCSQVCGNCATDTTCHMTNGICLNGCSSGYYGAKCITKCLDCFYGPNCSEKCGFCLNGTFCNHINGYCKAGCASGYTGDVFCPPGRFGQNCSQVCGNCATDTTCHMTNETCLNGCSSGYYGTKCISKCLDGFYGPNCSEKCGVCLNDTFCNHINGYCKLGCASGYTGDVCKTTCSQGRYGINCSNECGNCANITCDSINGTCYLGCFEGYSGVGCFERLTLKENTDGSAFSPQIIVTIVGTCVSALLIGIVIGCFLKRIRIRRRSASAASQRQESTYDELDRARGQNESSSDYAIIQMQTRMKH